MPLKVFAKQYRWNPKEEQWILDNDKDTHYYNNSALKNAWSSLSYPIYDGDYYFAFIHDKVRVNSKYNAEANRELRKYIKSFLNPEEIYDKMYDYFKRYKDAGSDDTMTREELWTAVVDMRKKNPAPKKESVNEIFGISQDPRYRAKVMKMLDDEGIKYKKDGRNALIILGVASKDQKKLLNRIHKEFGMSSYNIIDEGKKNFDVMDTYRDMMTEKVSYVEYKFKNRKDAENAMNIFKSTNLMSFDINDDNLNGGELAVDAGKKDMTKFHKQVMQKFRPKIQMSENYRKLAQKGMGTETKKDARVGLELDYYDSKGNKHMGKIVKKSATGYTVQDDKTRKTHTFKFHDRVDAKKLLAASNEFDKNPLKGFPYN